MEYSNTNNLLKENECPICQGCDRLLLKHHSIYIKPGNCYWPYSIVFCKTCENTIYISEDKVNIDKFL